MVLGPNVLSKGVETGPTVTHFGLVCTQTIPCLPGFDDRPMASRTAACKLWQTNIIRTIQEIVDKMNKSGQQGRSHRSKVEK